MSKYNLLLLTWTIKPDKWIKKQWYAKTLDKNIRLNQYLSNIYYYLSFKDINWIVFIDNSNYLLDLKIIDSIKFSFKVLWKEFEYLTFKWDINKQLEYTYWYWEFEIIEYMFNNSKLYEKATWLLKITWRYKIYNFDELLKDSLNKNNILYKYSIFNFNSYNTAFFKLSNDNIIKIIKNYKKLFDDNKNNVIRLWSEDIFFKILWIGKWINTSKVYPYFFYLSYKNYLLHQFLNSIWYFNVNSFIYLFLYYISKIIPNFLKIKFHKILLYIMKNK